MVTHNNPRLTSKKEELAELSEREKQRKKENLDAFYRFLDEVYSRKDAAAAKEELEAKNSDAGGSVRVTS